MKQINGMIDFSTENYYCRMFRGYTVFRNAYGMYTTSLENYPISSIQCDTVKAIKRAISKDINRGKQN